MSKFIVRFNVPPARKARSVPTVDLMHFDDEATATSFASRNRWGTEPSKVQRLDETMGDRGIGDHYEGHRRKSDLLSAYLQAYRALFPSAYVEIQNLERALESARNTGD